jgi:hypothetical protein
LARAKRTDRTDARRRYRAERTPLAPSGAAAAVATGPAPTSGRTLAPADRAPGGPRPSLGGSLRAAFRPLDLRGDLRALPTLVRHWSFWGPSLASIASAAAFIALVPAGTSTTTTTPAATSGIATTLVYLAFQMFVFPLPAPAGAAFIAGFGAPRASWLIGALVGLVAAIGFAVIVMSPNYATAAQADPGAGQGLALQGFLIAPVGSALFASAAAWYRRFLNLANPNRNARPAARPAQGRGNVRRRR